MAKKLMVRFRVSEAEMSAIISSANAHRLPVSSHVRSVVLMEIDKEQKLINGGSNPMQDGGLNNE